MRIGAISGTSPADKFISMPYDWLVKAGSGSDAAQGEDAASTTGAAHRKAIIAEESNLTGSDTSSAKGVDGAGKTEGADLNPGESRKVNPGRKSSPAECKTCKERKYQDGSDEMVSFKSASHISPEASAARVRAHEQEHVNNAYEKAASEGMRSGGKSKAKVIQASVSLKTAICPECGRSYVEGGVTHTQIAYKEDSPYDKEKKAIDAQSLSGANFEADV